MKEQEIRTSLRTIYHDDFRRTVLEHHKKVDDALYKIFRKEKPRMIPSSFYLRTFKKRYRTEINSRIIGTSEIMFTTKIIKKEVR